MASNTLETWLYNGHIYVTPKEAARYMGIDYKALLVEITKGQLPVGHIESRQLIELDTLQAFDISKYPTRRGR